MNSNHLGYVSIENFKSIKQVSFDCKRVNIFIGKPNVGKSNILEALGVFSPMGKLNDVVRFSKPYELFYDNDTSNNIKIFTDQLSVLITKESNSSSFYNIYSNNTQILDDNFEGVNRIRDIIIRMNNNREKNVPSILETSDYINTNWFNGSPIPTTNIRKYHFKPLVKYNEGFSDFLKAPFGENIWNILSSNKKLREEVSNLFLEYGLEFLMNLKDEKFELQKRIENLVYQYDYSLIADTLQRIIFHYAAIASNNNAVLLFEEPESHSYPGYISDLAVKIANSETNQFFIATHSPYLLGTLMEGLSYSDCAIFVCSYKNYETQIRELSEEEVGEAIDYGQDLFMNIDSFIEHE